VVGTENSHIPDDDTLANEVEVELDMLCALLLNGIGGEIHGTDVITVDKSAPCQRTVQLLEQLTKLCRLSDTISHSEVLGLGAGGEKRMELSHRATTATVRSRMVSPQGSNSIEQ
jgi:hypothetical protein